jgi:hypothetical protein
MEAQSLAGKAARAVQKQIDAMNAELMKAVLAEQSPALTAPEPMFQEPAEMTTPSEKPKKQK